jgi:hypothetical protein
MLFVVDIGACHLDETRLLSAPLLERGQGRIKSIATADEEIHVSSRGRFLSTNGGGNASNDSARSTAKQGPMIYFEKLF